MKLQSVDPKTLSPEIFRVFSANKALLTAGDREKCNTMTIGWCQLGCLWETPVCTVYVRPARYTYEFMENKDTFSVSLLPLSEQKTMAYCGSKSGRDVDKFAECGLTVAYGAEDTPYVEQAEWVLVCKKLYVHDLDADHSLGSEKISRFYTPEQGGWHRVYIGEVLEAYQKV